jgi:hypothetical protein
MCSNSWREPSEICHGQEKNGRKLVAERRASARRSGKNANAFMLHSSSRPALSCRDPLFRLIACA